MTLLPVAWGCKESSHKPNAQIRIAYIAKLKDGGFHDAIFKGIREESIKQNVEVDSYFGRDQQDFDGQRKFLMEVLQSKKYKGHL